MPADIFPGTCFKYIIRRDGIVLCERENNTVVVDFGKIGLRLEKPDMEAARFVDDLRKNTAEYISYISIYAESEYDYKTNTANSYFNIFIENAFKEY